MRSLLLCPGIRGVSEHTCCSSITMRKSIVSLAFLALVAVASASEFTHEDLHHLTNSDYNNKVKDGKVWFVKYYAPWCGHCKRLADTWKQLATSFKGSKQVAIAHVDCTTDRDVCTTADVKGYPTLKVIYKGEEAKSYRGARDLAALKTFITDTAKELWEKEL